MDSYNKATLYKIDLHILSSTERVFKNRKRALYTINKQLYLIKPFYYGIHIN